MALPPDSSKTVIKVRGKRRRTREENPQQGGSSRLRLQRARHQTARGSNPTSSGSTLNHGSKLRKQRQTLPEKSRLEDLPTEILQHIFVLSGNIDLVFTSKLLADKLSNKHMHMQLTTRLLLPVLGYPYGTKAAEVDLSNATNLLNRRFSTWGFFKMWMYEQRLLLAEHLRSTAKQRILQLEHCLSQAEHELSRRDLERQRSISWLRFYTDKKSNALDRSIEMIEHQGLGNGLDMMHLWVYLLPSKGLLPPKKLFKPPFTADNSAFLGLMVRSIGDFECDVVFREFVYEGLWAAVQDGNTAIAMTLLLMGASCDTQLFRRAVAEWGCNKEMVKLLLDYGKTPATHIKCSLGSDPLDMHDPVIWDWADRARERGDEKGQWLIELLRDAHANPRTAEHNRAVLQIQRGLTGAPSDFWAKSFGQCSV